jgi:L-amino acid N-acyltransferase YncA
MVAAMTAPATIEPVTIEDAEAVAQIYAHHVEHGTATFETVAPDTETMRGRIAEVLEAGSPWLVARDADGTIVGYAYAAQFRDRAAYRYTCENSVYIRHDRRGEGIGRALLALLIVDAGRAGFRQMIAVIGGPEPASSRLHAACGFGEVGLMRSVGRKHGAWLDTLYMQRGLGEGCTSPPEIEPG